MYRIKYLRAAESQQTHAQSRRQQGIVYREAQTVSEPRPSANRLLYASWKRMVGAQKERCAVDFYLEEVYDLKSLFEPPKSPRFLSLDTGFCFAKKSTRDVGSSENSKYALPWILLLVTGIIKTVKLVAPGACLQKHVVSFMCWFQSWSIQDLHPIPCNLPCGATF